MDTPTLLRTARLDAGLTLRELADAAGTSHSTLSAYESGRVDPRSETVRRVLAAAGWQLVAEPTPRPLREPWQASPGDELWNAIELADWLPKKPATERLPWHAPVFGRR